jgi:hypothetical protein
MAPPGTAQHGAPRTREVAFTSNWLLTVVGWTPWWIAQAEGTSFLMLVASLISLEHSGDAIGVGK